MPRVVHVNQEQFESEVLSSDIPVVVNFHATDCASCRALSSVLDRLAVEFVRRIKFVKVNSDDEPGLTYDCGVMELPGLIMVDAEGRNEGQYLGTRQEDDIRLHLQKWLASHVGSSGPGNFDHASNHANCDSDR